jgi:predicted DNA-binding transcriptional regulator YafY
MTRASRVLDLKELLEAREHGTVASFAGQLGVSRRTVLRDLATLRERGLPIDAEGGPGGGVRLSQERGLIGVHFAQDELVALWVTTSVMALTFSTPWAKPAERALNRMLASLPKERRRSLRRLVKRVIIGRPASARIYTELGTVSPKLWRVCEAAFTEGHTLALRYRDRHGAETTRRVEPHGLLVENPAWYLLARDLDKQQARNFRLDRILEATPIEGRRFEPDLETLHQECLAQQNR